jgi:hypothetical protein
MTSTTTTSITITTPRLTHTAALRAIQNPSSMETMSDIELMMLSP